MASLDPGITGRGPNHLEPLAVTPRQACVLLNVGNTKLYQLLGSGELESYLDGGARRIPMDSIRRRITMLLASANATGAATGRHAAVPPPQSEGGAGRMVRSAEASVENAGGQTGRS
jgi:excisionase family DNA binding protein